MKAEIRYIYSFLLSCLAIADIICISTTGNTAVSECGMYSHVMKDPDFWHLFSQEVRHKRWKCDFPASAVYDSMLQDSELYDNKTLFKERRKHLKSWIDNDDLWIDVLLSAIKDLVYNRKGPHSQRLESLGMLNALEDFTDHTNYFYQVAGLMDIRNEKVTVHSQNGSVVHDIDKLDPFMLVGYSEKFEDLKNTTLWNLCVDRHVHTNPHHQQHCLWHTCCRQDNSSDCTTEKEVALREMVCDKVSRRLQKNFGGNQNPEMWLADENFYNGLPQDWLTKAVHLMNALKNWKGNENI